MIDTVLSSLTAQIHFAVKANCLAPVVLLNMCNKSKLSEWMRIWMRMWWGAIIFELCKWAAKWKRLGMAVVEHLVPCLALPKSLIPSSSDVSDSCNTSDWSPPSHLHCLSLKEQQDLPCTLLCYINVIKEFQIFPAVPTYLNQFILRYYLKFSLVW